MSVVVMRAVKTKGKISFASIQLAGGTTMLPLFFGYLLRGEKAK